MFPASICQGSLQSSFLSLRMLLQSYSDQPTCTYTSFCRMFQTLRHFDKITLCNSCLFSILYNPRLYSVSVSSALVLCINTVSRVASAELSVEAWTNSASAWATLFAFFNSSMDACPSRSPNARFKVSMTSVSSLSKAV